MTVPILEPLDGAIFYTLIVLLTFREIVFLKDETDDVTGKICSITYENRDKFK